ncbi:hypothetical protein [Actinomadura verrucosospora]|uniref:DUF3592 domain-containing protein n=1 Tax=Actinomadura verrucosospora TaxID=46165 RepID=A0A7D3VTU6_ACTVE|nr:hypothetical protein [Actinomadura verrucosospora]QKG23075.1 hypothetical protein ACTIVE_4716 [Actinomadura verrucosospora]
MIIIDGLVYLVLLGVFAMGLFGFVSGVRGHEGTVAGGVIMMLAAVGIGWAMTFVVKQHHELMTSEVGASRAVRCTATILKARDARSTINGDHVYRFHVRVQTPGKAPYETDSTSAVSSMVAGAIGAGRTGYACRADRHHPKNVQLLWNHPTPTPPPGTPQTPPPPHPADPTKAAT